MAEKDCKPVSANEMKIILTRFFMEHSDKASDIDDIKEDLDITVQNKNVVSFYQALESLRENGNIAKNASGYTPTKDFIKAFRIKHK